MWSKHAKKDASDLVDRNNQWRRGQHESKVVPFVEELFRSYLTADEEQGPLLREAVSKNGDLWNFVYDDYICLYLEHLNDGTKAGTLAYLRGWLIAVSLTGGCADWRDTIFGLSEMRRSAELFDAEVSSYFSEIAATACRTNQLGLSEMSTCDLILYCGGIESNEKQSPNLNDPS